MPRSPIRPGNALLVGALLATNLVLAVPGANAACHIAGFVESSVEVDASAGSVTLTVELQGRQPACEGTVDWATEDGTATAGSDYEAGSGTLTFVAEDDRTEEITVTILDGASAGDFSVVLSNPTGSISGTGGAATVTITSSGTATEPATEGAATPADGPSIAPTEAPTPGVPEAVDDGARFPWIPLLAVVIVLGLLVAWYIARRTPAHPDD